ncbi:hypothetical protein ABDK00_013175 [Niabella insulamsoli]|uniref:hypothetical protein n=1 Tax=Niabella insulamsoli TaxID=3144874 RepID=UPI0031FCBA54
MNYYEDAKEMAAYLIGMKNFIKTNAYASLDFFTNYKCIIEKRKLENINAGGDGTMYAAAYDQCKECIAETKEYIRYREERAKALAPLDNIKPNELIKAITDGEIKTLKRARQIKTTIDWKRVEQPVKTTPETFKHPVTSELSLYKIFEREKEKYKPKDILSFKKQFLKRCENVILRFDTKLTEEQKMENSDTRATYVNLIDFVNKMPVSSGDNVILSEKQNMVCDLQKAGCLTIEQIEKVMSEITFFQQEKEYRPKTPIQTKKGTATNIAKAMRQLHLAISPTKTLTKDQNFIDFTRKLFSVLKEKTDLSIIGMMKKGVK